MVDSSGSENPQDYGLSDEQARRIAARYEFSPFQFRQQSEQVQQRILRRIRYDDLTQLRAEFSTMFLRGDNGEIAPDGYARAAERLREMRMTSRGRVAGMSVGPVPEGPLPPVQEHKPGVVPTVGSWISYGPGNIGGRIRSILITIENGTQKIYIGSAGGGIWTTTDTVTWQLADASMANLAVCSMAMAPNNRTTIYAGTGEGFSGAFDGLQGSGIFKTTDGQTWQQLTSTLTTDFLWVNGVATNGNGTVVLAGTRTGIFRSADGGATWTAAMPANVGNILFDPTNDMKCIAAMLAGGGIHYSEDGGVTWRPSANPSGSPAIGRIQVCYATGDTNIVYASVETIPGPGTGAGSQIWRSADGGKTFTKKNSSTNYLGTQGGYANIIWAGDPTNSNFIVVGGFNLYKSNDGGDTLVQISDGTIVPRSAHVDHHMIRSDIGYNGTTNKMVYFGNDGGLYMARDVTTVTKDDLPTNGWSSLNYNLPITQFYSVSGTFTTAEGSTNISSIVGGTQDNGTLRYTPIEGTNAWKKWATGDGGNVGVDPRNSLCYGEAPYLEVFRSSFTAGEMTADDICGYYYDSVRRAWTWKPRPYCIPDAIPNPQTGRSAALFIAPLVAIRGGQNLLAGGASLWRTDDPRTPNTNTTGPSWRSIKDPVSGALVSAISVRQPADDIYFMVGYDNGQIFMTADGGTFWSAVGTNIRANRPCTSVAVDNRDPVHFYATFSGFQTNNIWTSGVLGADWYSLGAMLPPVPIYCVTVHPQKSERLYLGTAIGIFASEDGGFTWAPNNDGPINCIVQQFVWMDNTLCCATYGRGSFAIDLTMRADLLVTGDAAGDLVASNAPDGAVVSAQSIAGCPITASPLIDGTSVYVARNTSPNGCALSKSDDAHDLRRLAWSHQLPTSVSAAPSLVKAFRPSDRDMVYAFASDGRLYGLDAGDGSLRSTLQVVPSSVVGNGAYAFSNQAMGDLIYIATDKGLYAVDIRRMAVAWSRPDLACSAPTLLTPEILCVPAQSTIHSIQTRTAGTSWAYNTGAIIKSKPVVAAGAVIVGNQGGRLVGLRGTDGAQQFTATFGGTQIQAIAADRPAVYFVTNSVVAGASSQLLAITPYATGFDYKWRVNLTAGASSPPQIFGTSLYLTTLDGKLQSFNTSGMNLWQQPLSGAVALGPAVVYA